MENLLMTDKDLAIILKVKPITIRTWVKRGQIPKQVIFKLPETKKGTLRFITSAVYKWLGMDV